VHVVTLLEEMPVQETLDTLTELTALGLPVGRVIVNAAREALLTGGRVTQAQLRAGLTAAGLAADRATVGGLHAEARDHLARQRREAAMRAELAAVRRPVVELPLLPAGVDRAGLDRLAAALSSP
jgi:hypothetical protein